MAKRRGTSHVPFLRGRRHNPTSLAVQVVKASLEDTAELISQMQEGQMPDEDEINDLAQEVRRLSEASGRPVH